jgi:hypothetical protein
MIDTSIADVNNILTPALRASGATVLDSEVVILLLDGEVVILAVMQALL